MWRVAFSGWNRGPYFHLRQARWGHKADTCHSTYMGSALHGTTLPGVLWQKIYYSLWLTYPLQRGDSSSIPVSIRKAEGLAEYLSTAPVEAYRFINRHPNGAAKKNRIGVGQTLCPNVSQLLGHWLCNLTNISFNISCMFLYKGLIYEFGLS